MKMTLEPSFLGAIVERLGRANVALANAYPGETGSRQPVHTVYGGAHLFKADSAKKMGGLGLRSLEQFAPEAPTLGRAVGMEDELAHRVYPRVIDKLRREPVEDFRIDFEDGYGNRLDTEEDGHAIAAAEETARGLKEGTLPPFLGIRIKPFTEELHGRAIRTLDLYMSALLDRTGGKLPDGFVVTLPKVQSQDQVAALADVMGAMEPKLGLRAGSLKIELMIETTQAILSPAGSCALPALSAAAGGRCVSAHFGTYDYTASCNITAAHQSMTHPECDFARHMMKVAYASTGVWLSDGATTVMPIPPHRAREGGPPLGATQLDENLKVVHRAWRMHFENIQHSLMLGFYQGWDLHPAQLPTRYAAVYAFFMESLEVSALRLKNFVEKAAQATLAAGVFDDAATGQGLLNHFLRGINCGALTEAETVARTGLTADEVRTRSFSKILQGRRS